MKKLAICIPTYNRAKLLNRLLKSIPALPNIVVSICDDGSNDNTFEVIKNHKSRFSIKYIYQENEGRASALRKSILNVSAEFMLIMGSDDYFTKNGISSILNSIKDNKTIKFFVFSTIISTNKGLKSESLKKIPITSYISVRSDYNITVWMNTIKEGRFEDTNKLFEKPITVDYEIKDYNYENIINEIQNRL